MRTLITITIILASAFYCKGQSHNLVPIDSAHLEIIADTLFQRYTPFPNGNEIFKFCPCAIDGVEGVISYKSASVFKRFNECLFLFKSGSDYYIRVGHVNTKDKSSEYTWKISLTGKVDHETAEKYIAITRKEINKADVPRSPELCIVNDGCTYIFGDLKNGIYATSPSCFFSASVEELIELSQKLIEDHENKIAHGNIYELR